MKHRPSVSRSRVPSAAPLARDESSAFWPDTLTVWLETLQGGEESARRHVLEAMARRYHPPILRRLRAEAPDLSVEDAEDICQQFFHDEFLGRGEPGHSLPACFDPAQGRLRAYLSQALRNFLAGWRRDRCRQKRGGGLPHVPIDEAGSLPAPDDSADTFFDQSWALRQFSLAFAALEEKWLATPEKARRYAVLKPYLMGEEDPQRRQELAATLELSPEGFRQELYRLRQDWHRCLRRVIASTVARPEDVEAELRYLCEVLGR